MSFEKGIKIKPISYLDIKLDEYCIRYTSLSKIEEVIEWQEIKSLSYIRDEAMFQDVYGPYNETFWMIKTIDKRFIRIEDESIHRNLLLSKFEERLAGFDLAVVKAAIKTKKQGAWDVYESNFNG